MDDNRATLPRVPAEDLRGPAKPKPAEPTRPMSEEEYLGIQDKLIMLGHILAGDDLGRFIGWLQRCHSLGSVLDPALYRLAMDRISALEDVARAGIALQKAHAKLTKIVAAEESSPAWTGRAELVRGPRPPG